MNNLPAELKQRIYEFDDTYKPSFENKIWFAIHMELIDKAKSYWYKRYPVLAPKILYNWWRDNKELLNAELDRLCNDTDESDYDDSDNDEDFDYTDSCDCCVKGWSKANGYGRCICVCECDKLYRDCQYKCKSESDDHDDRCVLCSKVFTHEYIGRNNAHPLTKGECCDECNLSKVIPTRMKKKKKKA